jgi:GT2 family glycosyltransferase
LALAEAAVTRPSTVILSIIVATYRRAESLEACLEDLAGQDSEAPFEVVVVLQAYPAGATDELRASFGERLHLVIAEFPIPLGTSRARNIGLKMSRGEIVAFLDDDVRLSRDWIRVMLGFYDDDSVGAVGGSVDHEGQVNFGKRAMYRLLGLTSNRYKIDWGGFNVGPAVHPARDQLAAWLSGGNMSFRRSVLATVGDFDEALGTFWHEDADLSHRVARSGWRMLSSRRMKVQHFPSSVNRPPLHAQMRERERSRVLFVWKAIGHKPLWRTRYTARLLLHAAAMSVVGVVKRDIRIPINVVRGGWEGYRGLSRSRSASEARRRLVG